MRRRPLILFLVLAGVVVASLVLTRVGTPPDTAEARTPTDVAEVETPLDAAQVRMPPDSRFAAVAPEIGEMVPDLEIVDDQGNPVRLRELTQGHYTVLTLGCLT